MSFSIKDPMIMREIILDNYQNPRNKEEVDDSRYITIHMDSASCIDDIYIYVLFEDHVVKDCKWSGVGCAISTASSSIMTEMIIGKSEEEALEMMNEFNKMLANEHYEEELLADANCFANVSRQPSRITCANISWRGLKKAIDQKENKDD